MTINLKIFRTIVLCTFALMAGTLVNAQTRTIKGTVTDMSGETVIGASISIPGSTIGTLSDVNGKYSMSVPTDATTLKFSFVGFETVTEKNK